MSQPTPVPTPTEARTSFDALSLELVTREAQAQSWAHGITSRGARLLGWAILEVAAAIREHTAASAGKK